MKNLIKLSLSLCLCLSAAITAFAQSQYVTITGTFTKTCYAEMSLGCKIEGKFSRLNEYTIDPTNNKFSFVIPVNSNATYSLFVQTKKTGGRHLEPDVAASFPLDLHANQNLSLTINPSELSNKSQAGLTIEQKPANFQTVSITGTLDNPVNNKFSPKITLGMVSAGAIKDLQSVYTDISTSAFKILVPDVKEGFYYISVGPWKKRLYLKPNDQLAFSTDSRTGMPVVWTKSTEENKLLSQWDELINPARVALLDRKLDEPTFTAIYKPLQPKITAFLQQVKTSNPRFNPLFKTAAQLDNNLLALNMLLKMQKGNYSMSLRYFWEVPAYYKQLIPENKISRANMLQLGEGKEYINLYAKFALTGHENNADKMSLTMRAISNDTLKAFLLESQLEQLQVDNYSEFCAVFKPYKKYATTPSAQKAYDATFSGFAADTMFIGKTAYNFTLPDKDGKMVSMKNFKGKVVFIDTWATWCGPCKYQIPFLQTLEKEYKGNNNIEFIGLSIDRSADKQKWLDMIKEKQLDGVQLLDDKGKAFAKQYKITAVPRFLLIDKKGNWAEIRCPLPEEHDKLKALIDQVIASN